jgi:hypothetical protein
MKFAIVAACLFLGVSAQFDNGNQDQNQGQGDDGSIPLFIQRFIKPASQNFGNNQNQIQVPQVSQNNPIQVPSIQQIQNQIQQAPVNPPSPQVNVYGPVETNWSTCPLGFLCCSQSVYKDTYKLLACCNDDSYDTRFQKCIQGVILPLVAGMPTPTPADRLIRINCGGYLYITTDSHRCCNFAVYDPDSQMCISGQVQTRPTPQQAPLPLGSVYVVCASYRFLLSTQATLTWGCCGQQLYNYNRENCTAGNIDPPRSMSDNAQVPKGELMIFCTGKRHWIDPSNLGSTRCCGTEICPLQSAPVVLNNNGDGTMSGN